MGGDSNLYYSIFRLSDGHECTSGFTSDSSTVAEFTAHMKARIDAELAEADPWNERAEADDLGVRVGQEGERDA